MNFKTAYIIFFLFLLGSQAQSQIDRAPSADSSQVEIPVPLKNALDTLAPKLDSLGVNPKDSSIIADPGYQVSDDAIDSEITYGSVGRKKIDLANKEVHLWDKAYVNYENIKVTADYIVFNFETNIVTATATFDSHGHLLSKATFSEGDQNFQYNSFKYNFKTEKGIVYQGVTKEGELFVHGGFTKLVTGKDSVANDVLYNRDAIITSCNLDHPHFGIRSNKIKVIPNKLAIIGPSWLEIADVPTPLWLPFGFFPISAGKSSGLILPNNYDFSQAWGFGLQNIGYYFPINDYMDLRLTGDIYLRGSWALNADFKYNKRYKYSGGLLASRTSRRQENLNTADFDRNVSYRFTWSHRQDPKAHPYRTFNTSVNILTDGYNNQNRTDAFARTQDNISSSVSYGYQFGESAWSLTGGANLTQSLSAGTVDIDAPNLKINLRQVYPFKRKQRIGKEKWYEKIGLTYSSEFRNRLSATDSTFYLSETWQDARYGVEHKASSNASFKFLKYFSFNPSANYSETWFFREINRVNDGIITFDTTTTNVNGEEIMLIDSTFGTVIESVENSFLPFRTGSIGGGVSTKLFWTETSTSGFLRGFRHTVTPNLTFSYSPDSQTPYEKMVDNDFRVGVDDVETYFSIPRTVFSASPRQEALGFNLNVQNIVEFKYYSKRDSMSKIFKLTNFTFNTGYNFVKDDFKLTNPSLTGRGNYFQNRMTVNYGFSIDPYQIENGQSIDRFVWQDGFALPAIDDFFLRTTTSLRFSEIRGWFSKDKEKIKQKSNSDNTGPTTFSSLFDNFSVQYKLDYRYTNSNGVVTTNGITANTINIRGNLQVTDNWAINLGNFGYDFQNKGYSYPDFGFTRNLHCWRMTFSWQPRGGVGFTQGNTSTFNFFIGVNGGTLDFLKYNYNRNNFDTLF